jgi:NAD(P)-dependent dehydrogenase (short-subunit alcohol dehydrogenase family)
MSYEQPLTLAGKVAVVTGASRGIGEAIARALAEAGADLLIAARRPEGLAAAGARLRETGRRVEEVPTHTGDADQCRALIGAAVERLGGVDILVNNAATNPHYGPLLTSEDSMWEKTLQVNLLGYFHAIQAAAPVMAARRGGKVINIASIAGLRPLPGMGLYGLSKAAVIHLTQTLAVELGPLRVQVNAIAPGFVRTEFSRVLWENEPLAAGIVGATPSAKIAEPDEIARIALLLASPGSDFVTGQTWVADGGYTLTPAGPRSQ